MTTLPWSAPPTTTGRRWSLGRASLASLPARRKLQLGLGVIWLIDAALQYQPYMFSRDFVNQTIVPTAADAPYFVAHPTLWAAHLMVHHIALYNAVFATIQLLIALGIFFRPAVRLALLGSVAWSLLIWWLGEGIGGITNGASPIMGSPGAVVLYAFAAILVWPRSGDEAPVAGSVGSSLSVAERSPLGHTVPKLAWALLWAAFAQELLTRANRAPSGLYDMVTGMEGGEPGWIKALDRGLAAPLRQAGTEWSISLAVLCAAIALAVFVPGAVRAGMVAAIVVGVLIWLAEDFGGIFTSQGTDVNSGPLLVLLALAYWPLARRPAPT